LFTWTAGWMSLLSMAIVGMLIVGYWQRLPKEN